MNFGRFKWQISLVVLALAVGLTVRFNNGVGLSLNSHDSDRELEGIIAERLTVVTFLLENPTGIDVRVVGLAEC